MTVIDRRGDEHSLERVRAELAQLRDRFDDATGEHRGRLAERIQETQARIAKLEAEQDKEVASAIEQRAAQREASQVAVRAFHDWMGDAFVDDELRAAVLEHHQRGLELTARISKAQELCDLERAAARQLASKADRGHRIELSTRLDAGRSIAAELDRWLFARCSALDISTAVRHILPRYERAPAASDAAKQAAEASRLRAIPADRVMRAEQAVERATKAVGELAS